MKTFPIAVVAVALVAAFVCVQESDAVAPAESSDLVQLPTDYGILNSAQDMPGDSMDTPYESAMMRGRRRCRFCCGCCPDMVGCGTCCKF
ncbi:hepcidin-like isoform X1 [Poecilia latipinna]|uniref:hepcidin-like isoform X1 n=1 Tax=Poecilia latipinna TaxID=48699 RepID=UPI00072E9B4C|nr:PREDICTED: hepcidin-like isoform X1 [Poecilia latipinna]